MKGRTWPTGLAILAIVGAVAWSEFSERIPSGTDDGAGPEACGDTPCEQVRPEDQEAITLRAAEVCVDVGYLCTALEREASWLVARWPDDTERIRVRVPLPPNESSDVASRLQAAAARGILRWNGNPFEIVLDLRRRSVLPADIVIEWAPQLEMNRLGVTRTRVGTRGRTMYYAVDGLALATRSPSNVMRNLDPDQVMLTAAHEMGHALGLPHSDEARDVMYELNTARNLTNRDYRTLGALYALPRGARIVR